MSDERKDAITRVSGAYTPERHELAVKLSRKLKKAFKISELV